MRLCYDDAFCTIGGSIAHSIIAHSYKSKQNYTWELDDPKMMPNIIICIINKKKT